jgi:hypothetical protein
MDNNPIMSNAEEALSRLSSTLPPINYNPFELLPIAPIPLTSSENERVQLLQNALVVLGPAGGSCLVCPGNQLGVPEQDRCPYSSKCELLKMQRAPEGQLCPIEANYIATRFSDWAKEINKNIDALTESERAFVSDITWIDTQALRCTSILSKGEASRLTQMNPKETHQDTLVPISWERVLHTNVVRLDLLVTQRRMLLKDWMLTPEQKAKKAKWEGRAKGDDISTRQSATADKLRDLDIIVPSDSPLQG